MTTNQSKPEEPTGMVHLWFVKVFFSPWEDYEKKENLEQHFKIRSSISKCIQFVYNDHLNWKICFVAPLISLSTFAMQRHSDLKAICLFAVCNIFPSFMKYILFHKLNKIARIHISQWFCSFFRLQANWKRKTVSPRNPLQENVLQHQMFCVTTMK